MSSVPSSISNQSVDCSASVIARANRTSHLSAMPAEITAKTLAVCKIDTNGSFSSSPSKNRHDKSISLKIKPSGRDVKAALVSGRHNVRLKLSAKRQRGGIWDDDFIFCEGKIDFFNRGDISLLSAYLRWNQAKRNCCETAPSWTIKDHKQIITDFALPGTVLPIPGGSIMRHKEQEPRKPFNGTSGEVQLPEVNTDRNECNKDTSAAHKREFDDASKLSFQVSDLQRMLASGYDGEVEMVPKSLLGVMPLRFLKSFREDSQRCTAWTIQGQRCKIAHSIKLLSTQLEALVSFELGALYQRIEELIEVFFCASHRKVAHKRIRTWEDDFKKLRLLRTETSAPSPQDKRQCSLFRWVRFLHQATIHHTSLYTSVLSYPTDSTNGEEPSGLKTIQFFKPHPSSGLKEPLSEMLKGLMTKPLQTGDIRSQGSIYVFWNRGNFGKLKIGRSTNVRRRLQEWNKQCKREMGIHYPDLSEIALQSASDTQQVPHISRVEALVHLELRHYRKIEVKCAGCSKSHVEWFEVSKDIAIDVVRKWTSWMITHPYERRTTGSQEQWILKMGELSRADRLCQKQQPMSCPSLPAKKQLLVSSHLRSSIGCEAAE